MFTARKDNAYLCMCMCATCSQVTSFFCLEGHKDCCLAEGEMDIDVSKIGLIFMLVNIDIDTIFVSCKHPFWFCDYPWFSFLTFIVSRVMKSIVCKAFAHHEDQVQFPTWQSWNPLYIA